MIKHSDPDLAREAVPKGVGRVVTVGFNCLISTINKKANEKLNGCLLKWKSTTIARFWVEIPFLFFIMK